jgi:N-acetylglucosaminyldiphosphoundecaprenol N-acetyl-beta-D-mannosaminyltransferase
MADVLDGEGATDPTIGSRTRLPTNGDPLRSSNPSGISEISLPPTAWRSVELDGVDIHHVDESQARSAVLIAVESRTRPLMQVITVNLDFLAIASRDLEFRAVLRRGGLVLADGMPVVWLSRLLGDRLPGRVAGSDLTAWIIGGGLPHVRVFLLGAAPGVGERVAERARSNGVTIAGVLAPSAEVFASPSLSAQLVEQINSSPADVLLVALGAPKQDKWIDAWSRELDVSVAIGVGGSLDLLAGDSRRAPPWAHRVGLEWAFRLAADPVRLWRRYMLRDLPYLVTVARRLAWKRLRQPVN